ncbi:MAG: hypothetical protein Q8Q35_04725 [Nanoarchaeota archaeon]|nr:hypothetical protein [Nanoarchaeota archaeon]
MKKLFIILIFILLLSGIASAECFDSDGGKNKFEFGGVTDKGITYQDECEGPNVKESFCSIENIASYTTLPCINGCEEGACLISAQAPKSLAPEVTTENDFMFKFYGYGIIILIIIALYVYWFKIKRKKRF